MRSVLPLKQFAVAFLMALALYIVMYTFIENRRTRHGPWQIEFTMSAGGAPALVVNEPRLNIANFRIAFPNEFTPPTNLVLSFSQPRAWPFDVPFGNCLFEDLTFQPGTLAFNLFGHEIQLIPRVLTVDGREYPWQSGATVAITNHPTLPLPQLSPVPVE
jgi:hypothetical protein